MPEANRPFRVHQAIHGYKSGHRLLAASSSLDVDSEANMLTMSDVLISEPLESTESYLTGYPLKHAHKFVLARTWAAPESPRRGSVWTHSLLLDYSTLTQLEDVFVLLKLFRRPTLESLSEFEEPSTVWPSRANDSLQFNNMLATDDRTRSVLAMLYGPRARNKIRTLSRSAKENEALALGVWRQMWPSLRRSFSFSTRASAEELSLGDFRLTFERDDLSQGSAEDTDTFYSEARGLDYLSRDLPKRGPTRLRRFLGRYAYDASNPRLIVPSLAAIFAERRDTLDALSSYDELLRDAPGLLRLKHDLLLASAKDRANPASLAKSVEMFAHEPAGSSISTLLEQIREAPFIANGKALVRVTSESPAGSIGAQIFPVLLQVLPVELLAKEVPSRFKYQLLDLRREVVRQTSFWPASGEARGNLLANAIEWHVPIDDLLVGLSRNLGVKDARQLIGYDESSLLPLYELAVASGNDELLDFLPLNSEFLSVLSKSNLVVPIGLLERFASVLMAKDPVPWCSPSETATLISRSGARPTYAQPNLATLAFSGAALSTGPESHWLFECAFDATFDSSDRFSMPRACERILLDIPVAGAAAWLPERLLDVVLAKYSQEKRIDAHVFCVSANPYAISRLARKVIRNYGEDELRHVHSNLGKLNSLQVPRSVVVKAIETAMPFFSKPLGKK